MILFDEKLFDPDNYIKYEKVVLKALDVFCSERTAALDEYETNCTTCEMMEKSLDKYNKTLAPALHKYNVTKLQAFLDYRRKFK